MTEDITLTVEGNSVRALFAKPDGAGPFPGIVVTYHRGGLDEFTHWLVDELAGQGYVAISPDHFHWLPPGVDASERKAHLYDTRLASDLAVARGYLECLEEVDGDRIGIIGHCMGGRNTILGIGCDPHYQAACVWYSGGVFNAQGPADDPGPSPYDRMTNIRCPVMGFFGNEDKNPSPEDVDKMDAVLTAEGVEHVFHRYDDAGHAFMNPAEPRTYREGPAKDSWARALVFLKEKLG